MPLARIITRSPQATIAASEYLRSLGYTIETVSPGDFRVTPAEVEFNLDKCGPREALARVKARLESPESSAPAETSAVPIEQPEKAKVAIAYDIAGRPVEFAEEEEALPERRRNPNSFVSALVSLFARAKKGIAAGVTGAWESVRNPAAKFQQERAEQRALKMEAELAQDREEVRYQEELARERLRQQMERLREQAEVAERQRQHRLAAERDAEERHIAAQKAAAEAAAAERERIEAERAAALVTQERARIEAERQAAALRAQQETAGAAEHEAAQQQQAPIIPAEGAAEPSLESATNDTSQAVEPAPPASTHVARLPHRIPPRVQPFMLRRPRAPIAISRKAVVTAIGASLIVLLGFVAFANRRPASPLASGALMRNDSVKQATPFGAATITPPPATAPKPRAAVAPAKSSPAVRSSTHKARSTRRTARRLRRQSEDEPVAEDEVVVRHFRSPRPKPQPTASNAKLKQYSDVE